MLIGYMHTIYDWLLLYHTYTMANACAYTHMFVITTTHSVLLLKYKKDENKISHILHAYDYASYYIHDTTKVHVYDYFWVISYCTHHFIFVFLAISRYFWTIPGLF